MNTKLRATLIVCAMALPTLVLGQAKFKYIGTSKCMPCHLSVPTGAAHKVWKASKHANAFATLATPAALEIVKKKGIADPQKDQACLKCHDTAAGVAAAELDVTFKPGEGVGCEACHGPGSGYKTIQMMKDIDAGKVKGETVGLMKGDEKLCVKCHNAESPTFKSFTYAEAWKTIAHPTPKKP
jgi:hypothetical protein